MSCTPSCPPLSSSFQSLCPGCLTPALEHPDPFPPRLPLFPQLDSQSQTYGLQSPSRRQVSCGSFRAPLRQLPAYLCNCCSVMSVFPQAVAVPNTTRSERVSIHSPPLTTKKIIIVIAIMTIMIIAHI